MQAFEFEADAKKNIILIPPQYKHLYSKHLKVIVLVPEECDDKKSLQYNFSDIAGKLEWQGDAVNDIGADSIRYS